MAAKADKTRFEPDPHRQRKKLHGKKLKKLHANHNRLKVKKKRNG